MMGNIVECPKRDIRKMRNTSQLRTLAADLFIGDFKSIVGMIGPRSRDSVVCIVCTLLSHHGSGIVHLFVYGVIESENRIDFLDCVICYKEIAIITVVLVVWISIDGEIASIASNFCPGAGTVFVIYFLEISLFLVSAE